MNARRFMNAHGIGFGRWLATGAGVALLAGCSLLPEAKSDPTRFYVLSTATTEARVAPPASAPALHLRPIEVASYLNSRPLIVRRGNNEIEFREFARWGEALELGIARVLREELLARGAVSTVLPASARRTPGERDLNLSVRVLACEGAANGAVEFRAVWELAPASGTGGTTASGDYRAANLRWDGKSEASLAAQLSQAVSGLAAEISGAIKS
jgi:uncharacterized protein